MTKPTKLSEAEQHLATYSYKDCLTGKGRAVRIACDFRLDVKNLLAELAAKEAEIARLREENRRLREEISRLEGEFDLALGLLGTALENEKRLMEALGPLVAGFHDCEEARDQDPITWTPRIPKAGESTWCIWHFRRAAKAMEGK